MKSAPDKPARFRVTRVLALIVILFIGALVGFVSALMVVWEAGGLAGAVQLVPEPIRKLAESKREEIRRPLPNDRAAVLSPEQEEQLQQIMALGYVSGSTAPPAQEGVTVHDAGRAQPGLNLVLSAHDAQAALMAMDGTVLHAWQKKYDEVWPGAEALSQYQGFFRRAFLYPNGDLLAVFENSGLIKLDRDSNVLWAKREMFHHVAKPWDDGTVLALCRHQRTLPEISPSLTCYDDDIVVMQPDGTELRRVSVFECVMNSPFRQIIRPEWLKRKEQPIDVLHTNDLQVLDGQFEAEGSAFKRGNLLISLHEQSFVGILEPEKQALVWGLTSMWRHQHNPRLLSEGDLIVFDNFATDESSKVIELNPFTQEVLWVYEGDAAHPFFTKTCGAAQRLPNGNTLITESNRGRAFEVTPQKEIVWEYVNPERAGDNDEFIADLMDVTRLAPDDPALEWFAPAAGNKPPDGA